MSETEIIEVKKVETEPHASVASITLTVAAMVVFLTSVIWMAKYSAPNPTGAQSQSELPVAPAQ